MFSYDGLCRPELQSGIAKYLREPLWNTETDRENFEEARNLHRISGIEFVQLYTYLGIRYLTIHVYTIRIP